MSDIGERVKKIVVEHLGVEEEFGCEIPDDAAETILTVGDAVKFLEKNAKS
jgi:acyl carrier protein